MAVETEVKMMMAKAEELLKVAKYLYEGGFYESVANRVYYSEFTAVSALLHSVGLEAKTHKGTHSHFSESFFKNGKIYKAFIGFIF